MNYLLFVFAKHENNQESIVKILAEDMLQVANCDNVNFYYGDESIIYYFSSDETVIDLKEYFDLLLATLGIVYFMIPFDPDKMSYFLDPEVEKQLFNTDKKSNNFIKSKEAFEEAQNLIFPESDDDDDILIFTPREKSLDEILDKISECGIDSLSYEEKKLLKNYSNN